LNEKQYDSLCEACDRVLLASDSTTERIAIPWLHVIREHPIYLANYVDLFEFSKGGKAIFRKWWRILRSRAVWLRQLLRSLSADGQPWFGVKEPPIGIDVLFVSHLLNPSQAGQEVDFYFGKLPDEMDIRGHSTVIALINHTDQAGSHLAEKWKGSSVPRMILSGSLRFWEEVGLRRRLKLESLRLRKIAKKKIDQGLSCRVFARASEEALSSGSLTNLRMAGQIGVLVAKLQPKALVVTYEGYAWERVAFAAARSVCPSVRCLGYQHAAVFRRQHALRRNLAREYNPDQILTAGTVGKAQLERAPGMRGILVSLLGSNRGFKADANKLAPTMPLQGYGDSDKRACLVLPEGYAIECELLFEFSLACAQACQDIQFIWRLHPIVTFETLKAKNPKLRILPDNVVLSNKTMDEDIALCHWALYRGTTAIIQAVGGGLRPIYLQVPGEMSIDPLYELKDWRLVIGTPEEFIQATNMYSDDKNRDSQGTYRENYAYCERFYSPFDCDALVDALSINMKKKLTNKSSTEFAGCNVLIEES